MQNTTILLPQVLAQIGSIQALVFQAGEAIMHVYKTNSPQDYELKVDQSPVTLADQLAHDHLCRGLLRLFPTIAIRSEEGAVLEATTQADPHWLIDPLDGTKEFLARQTDFTVNIALIIDHRTVWGMVYAPALNLLYWGGAGLGAYRQVDSQVDCLQLSHGCSQPKPCRIVASRSHLNEATQAWIAQWPHSQLIQAGSSLKFCRLAEDQADIYPRLGPTCEWDTAAAQAVLEGAGGYVFDLQGQPLIYGKSEILNPSFIASRWSWQDLRGLLDV